MAGNYSDLKVTELKEELKKRKLKVGGKKDELIARLQDHDEQAAKGGDEEPARHAGEAAVDKAAAEEAAAEDSAQHDPPAASAGTRSRVGNRGKAATAEATSEAATEPKEATSPAARSTRTGAAPAEKADEPSDSQKQAQAPATGKKHAAAKSGGEKPAEAAAAEGAKPAAVEMPAGQRDAMPEAAEGEEVAAAELPADRLEAVPEAKQPAVLQPSTTGGAGTTSSGVASSAPGPAAAAAAAAAKGQTSEQQAPAAAQPQLPTGSVKPDEAASPRHKSQAGSPAKKQRGAGENLSAQAVPTDSSKPEGKGHEVGAHTKSAGQASSPVDEAPAAQQAAPAATPAETAAAGPASKELAAPVGDIDMAEATQAAVEVAEEELDLELDYDSTLLTAAEEAAPEAATTRREQEAAPAARSSARDSRKRGRDAEGADANGVQKASKTETGRRERKHSPIPAPPRLRGRLGPKQEPGNDSKNALPPREASNSKRSSVFERLQATGSGPVGKADDSAEPSQGAGVQPGPRHDVRRSVLERATAALSIDGFQRPFSLPQVNDLLAQFGTIKQWWMPTKRNYALVVYSSVAEAQAAYVAVDHMSWPDKLLANRLRPEFLPVEEAENKIAIANGEEPPHRGGSQNPQEAADKPAATGSSDLRALLEKQRSKGRGASETPAGQAAAQQNGVGPEQEEKTLDMLFQRTTTKPMLYWLPVSEAQQAERKRKRAAGDEPKPMAVEAV